MQSVCHHDDDAADDSDNRIDWRVCCFVIAVSFVVVVVVVSFSTYCSSLIGNRVRSGSIP